MKQIVPVSFDPFAPDSEEQKQTNEPQGKASGTTKLRLEVTLSPEVMTMLKHIMTSLDAMLKPKKLRLIRDANGMASEAVAEYDKPERLN